MHIQYTYLSGGLAIDQRHIHHTSRNKYWFVIIRVSEISFVKVQKF